MTARKVGLFVAFVATVYGANWAIEHLGTQLDPFGPHTIPVGFGLDAPSGVLFAGLAFGLRDALHEAAGRWWVIAAILAGAALSWALGASGTIPGGHVSIAVASGVAFLFSETCDLLAYEPLRERNWPAAVAVSNVIGAVVDSALFLWLAFGSLDFIEGQVLGKTWVIVAALPVVWLARRQREPAYA